MKILQKMISYQKIISQVENKIGIITMNSEKDLNALSSQMKQQLSHSLKSFQSDPKIKIIILLSNVKKAFCAGANIKDFINKSSKDFLHNDIFQQISYNLSNTSKPIISAVNGVALGGGFQLCLLTDIIICSEQARFGLPELNLGLIPGLGGTQRLTKIVGKSIASKYIFSSQYMDAQTALRLKIVTDIYKYQQLHQKALQLANKISEKSMSSLIAAKKSIKASQQHGITNGVNIERDLFYSLFDSQGVKQGTEAFVNKRKPNFEDC